MLLAPLSDVALASVGALFSRVAPREAGVPLRDPDVVVLLSLRLAAAALDAGDALADLLEGDAVAIGLADGFTVGEAVAVAVADAVALGDADAIGDAVAEANGVADAYGVAVAVAAGLAAVVVLVLRFDWKLAFTLNAGCTP